MEELNINLLGTPDTEEDSWKPQKYNSHNPITPIFSWEKLTAVSVDPQYPALHNLDADSLSEGNSSNGEEFMFIDGKK